MKTKLFYILLILGVFACNNVSEQQIGEEVKEIIVNPLLIMLRSFD